MDRKIKRQPSQQANASSPLCKDYTKERHKNLDDLTIDQIVDEIKRKRAKRR